MKVDSDAQAFLARVAASGNPPYETLSAVAARGFYNAGRALVAAPPESVAELRTLSAPGPNGPVGLRFYRPASQAKLLPILVYLHGGGWVLGDLDSHDSVCRALANRSEHLVVSVDYRLAPEHPFPAGLEAPTPLFAGSPTTPVPSAATTPDLRSAETAPAVI
jgi:acetyl esterase